MGMVVEISQAPITADLRRHQAEEIEGKKAKWREQEGKQVEREQSERSRIKACLEL
jgi:hypothetical protein